HLWYHARGAELSVSDVADIAQVRFRIANVVKVYRHLLLVALDAESQVRQRVRRPAPGQADTVRDQATVEQRDAVSRVAVIRLDESVELRGERPGVDAAHRCGPGGHAFDLHARHDAGVRQRA